MTGLEKLDATVASLAESAQRFAEAVTCVEWVSEAMVAALSAGYQEGRAGRDRHLATGRAQHARAQKARAAFQVIKGGAS